MVTHFRRPFITALLVIGTLTSVAATEQTFTRRHDLDQTINASGKPSLRVLRVEKGPKVDGRLDEELWQRAPVGGDLIEYSPTPGDPMSERTEFRIVYDATHLYIGVWCYDSEPDKITARIMERDGSLFVDDYIIFALDTFRDKRNGYQFWTNPNGAKRDSLISNNNDSNSNWDGVWDVRPSIDHEGWKLEIAIPFKTLSFDPKITTWGFNISRNIRRKSERGRWTAALPQFRTRDVSEAGTITGLRGLHQGRGLEFSPYFVSRYHKDGDTDITGDFGGEFRYRITPNLSGTLSYNTDFAETEVDQRQLNFTRFPLFFPEKRGFFLEDSGIFRFGGSGELSEGLIPFFSRRIGRTDDGEVVPIIAAGKIAGRIGPYNIGIMDAVMQEHAQLDVQNAFVGRVSRNLWQQSSLGLITTIGDPSSTDNNYVIGPDFHYRTTSFMQDKTLEASAFALGNRIDGAESSDSYAYGLSVAYPNDRYSVELEYMEVDEDFDPALGFVRRKGVRGYASSWRYRHRPASIQALRQYRAFYGNEFFTHLNNDLDTAQHSFTPIWIEFDSADELYLSFRRRFDGPQEDFQLLDDVTVPAGDYWWNYVRFGFQLAGKRMIGGEAGISIGEFYDGHRQTYSVEVDFLPWKHLGLNVDYAYNVVDLPGGSFQTHITATRMIWNFTPRLTWSHLIQYDTLSEIVGLNSRLQWEYQPGSRIFLVLNQAYFEQEDSFVVDNTELALKIGAVFRF